MMFLSVQVKLRVSLYSGVKIFAEEMPSACKVYELSRATLDSVIEVLEKASSVVTLRRTSTGASGFIQLAEGLRIPFEIYIFRGRVYLIVMAGKRKAAKVARNLSKLVNINVIEINLQPEKFLNLYAGSVIKLVVFDMVKAPGLRRVVLSGAAVSDSELYKELAELGEIRYVLFQTGEGQVLGISDTCTIVALSKLAEEDLLATVKENLLPVISPLV